MLSNERKHFNPRFHFAAINERGWASNQAVERLEANRGYVVLVAISCFRKERLARMSSMLAAGTKQNHSLQMKFLNVPSSS